MWEHGIARTGSYYDEPWGWKIIFLGIMFYFLFFYNNQHSKPLPPITSIVVEKRQHKMTVYHKGNAIKMYKVALGSGGLGAKQNQGDRKTPEGSYKIISKSAKSQFHLSLKISYPNTDDAKHAFLNNVDPGNNIMIHGLRNGLGWVGKVHAWMDWTKGCIAVSNSEIEEIYEATPIGTPIEIKA